MQIPTGSPTARPRSPAARARVALQFALLPLVLALLGPACAMWPPRSNITNAFVRDPEVAIPAILALGQSERPEAESVLLHILHDPDPLRQRTASQALQDLKQRRDASAAATAAPGKDAEQQREAAGLRSKAQAEIRALNAAMEQAMRHGDLAAVAAFYADDALLMDKSGRTVAGRQAIDEYWGRLEGAQDWELSIASLEGADKLWIQRGHSRLSVLRDGVLQHSNVEFMLVWRRQENGQLLIGLDAYW